VKALVIGPDGSAINFDSVDSLNSSEGLEWLQHTVGGYIEGVYGNGWHLYCNEEAKLLGLPVNSLATMFAKHLGWHAHDVLNGTVIFLGDGIDGMEDDLPEWVFAEFGKFIMENY
jgi:Domain of unknown function (DUF3846)